MLFAVNADEGAAWAVIGILAGLLLTFLTTARRDARKADAEAVAQWKDLAETAIAAREAADQDREKLLEELAAKREHIAQLIAENKYLRGEGK